MNLTKHRQRQKSNLQQDHEGLAGEGIGKFHLAISGSLMIFIGVQRESGRVKKEDALRVDLQVHRHQEPHPKEQVPKASRPQDYPWQT